MVGEKTTLEKPLVGRNCLPRGGPGGKAPNREISRLIFELSTKAKCFGKKHPGVIWTQFHLYKISTCASPN